MISQIVFDFLVLSLSFVAVSYLLSLRKRVERKNEAARNIESISPALKGLDWGFFGTMWYAWKYRATPWDDIPPYEGVLDALNDYKVKLGRFYYFINWGSAARIVVTSDLETVKEVFRSSTWINHAQEDHYLRAGTFGKPLGILFGDGHYWKESRKAVLTAFRETNLMNATHIEDLYLREAEVLVDELREKSSHNGGKLVFSPQHTFDYPIIHVAFKMLFGRRLLESDPVEGTLMNQLNLNNSTFNIGTGPIEFFPFLKYFQNLLPTGRAYLRLCRTIYDIIALERDRRGKEKGSSSSCPQDVLSSLLKTMDEHAGRSPNYFTFENVQATIRDLVLAGSDTTNVTLQHLILFMAIHQDKQQKVYDEIDLVVGNDRWPTYEDRKRMIYTQAVVLETFRLGHIIPVSIRINSKDCKIGDLELKKGTYFIPAYIGIHRSKDLWEDPLVFRPERFISDDGRIVNTEKIIPFSYGPRACVGELNGRIGVFMFAIMLLREFKWELSDTHPPPSMRSIRGLSRPPAPYFVKMSRRRVPN